MSAKSECKHRANAEVQAASQNLNLIASTYVDSGGTIEIFILNQNGRPSPVYTYRSSSGKVEEVTKIDGYEWIGAIRLSPNLLHRVWGATKSVLEGQMGLPTTAKELTQLIESRKGDKKLWWRLEWRLAKKGNTQYVSLPRLLHLMEAVESPSDSKDAAIISCVTVAPHRQKQGFGLMLHEMAASHLKGLGYKKMISDLVGLNTKGEVAVWQAMQKKYTVEPFMLRYDNYALRILLERQVIDKKLYALFEKKNGFHVNEAVMSFEQMSKTKFQQFELDLTDERIQVLEKAA